MNEQVLSPRSKHRAAGRRSVLSFLRNLLIIIVAAVLLSLLIRTFVIRSFYIPSGSMENTLQINDRIIVNELEPRFLPIHRGDVVVFSDPGGWLPASMEKPVATNPARDVFSLLGLAGSDSDKYLVKRVIGLPGDRVSCCNASGQLTVNGAPLTEPFIVIPPGSTNAGVVRFDVTVPRGELWVMGDNRYKSQDSSLNQNLPGKGFVPIKDVVGRAIIVSWPLDHWKRLSDYPKTFYATARTDHSSKQ